VKQKKKKEGFKKSLFLALGIVVLDWFFQIYFRKLGVGMENFGVSFGLASNLDWFWKVLIPIIFLALMLYELISKKKLSVYLLCLALGGVGNMLPRFIFGSVWDYIHISFLGLWINMSDVLISISVLSYILITNGDSDCI